VIDRRFQASATIALLLQRATSRFSTTTPPNSLNTSPKPNHLRTDTTAHSDVRCNRKRCHPHSGISALVPPDLLSRLPSHTSPNFITRYLCNSARKRYQQRSPTMMSSPYDMRSGGDGRNRKQSMAELKLRRLQELNARLKEDLERRRIPVSEAANEYASTTLASIGIAY
jgi:hypothetical protein